MPINRTALELQAFKEVVAQTIILAELGADFLEMWLHRRWASLRKYYPEFDLTTEAQKHLIAASGGEQS